MPLEEEKQENLENSQNNGTQFSSQNNDANNSQVMQDMDDYEDDQDETKQQPVSEVDILKRELKSLKEQNAQLINNVLNSNKSNQAMPIPSTTDTRFHKILEMSDKPEEQLKALTDVIMQDVRKELTRSNTEMLTIQLLTTYPDLTNPSSGLYRAVDKQMNIIRNTTGIRPGEEIMILAKVAKQVDTDYKQRQKNRAMAADHSQNPVNAASNNMNTPNIPQKTGFSGTTPSFSHSTSNRNIPNLSERQNDFVDSLKKTGMYDDKMLDTIRENYKNSLYREGMLK